MEDEELKQEKEVSKRERSQAMNLQKQQKETELNSKNIASELNAVSQKNDERKYNENQIDFLVNEFALTRNKAVNLLRKMDLKQAVRHLVNA